MARSKKEVAKAKNTLPTTMSFEDDADKGFEQTDASDYAIPFLVCLQKLSPVCDEDSPNYVEGAKPGQLYNTVNGKRIPARSEDGEFVRVIPVAYMRQFIEWKPRGEGVGFVAVHDVAEGEKLLTECVRDEKNRDITPDGNHLVDTRQHYVLLEDTETGEWNPIIIGMSSTQVKVSRKWMTQMKEIKLNGKNGKFTPPMFSHYYHISTLLEQNDKGSWRSFKITMGGMINDELAPVYEQAKAFRDMVVAGETKAAYSSAEGEAM